MATRSYSKCMLKISSRLGYFCVLCHLSNLDQAEYTELENDLILPV